MTSSAEVSLIISFIIEFIIIDCEVIVEFNLTLVAIVVVDYKAFLVNN